MAVKWLGLFSGTPKKQSLSLRPDMQWIATQDQLPTNDDYVLLYVDLTELANGRKCGTYEIGLWDGIDWRHGGDRNGIVSHWMPLPEKPEQ